MNVAVHVIATGSSGSGKPSEVNTGTGGQAVGASPSLVVPWCVESLQGRSAPRRPVTARFASRRAHRHGRLRRAGKRRGYHSRTPSAVLGAVPAVGRPDRSRRASPADSERVHFIPELLILPGDADAPVVPAQTVNGVLQVPESVQHVGWWDGSAYAGDPFGATVIAGHVDSATEGIGFFARLLKVKVGDRVTVRAGPFEQRYRIIAVQLVAKQALASDSRAFEQTGAHRLVLITCTGTYHRDRGGYDTNLVVIGKPLGLAR